MNKIQEQDIREFADYFVLGNLLSGTTILITGATGLIGSTLIRCLLAIRQNIRIIAPVRNKEKAMTMFPDIEKSVDFIECDILNYDYSQVGDVDYIVHCAAPTSSKFFVEHPVETFNTIVKATSALLDYARRYSVKSFIYLSSLEVYGSIHDDNKPVTEEIQGYLDPMSVRSSYPMAKRAAENLCCLYAAEYRIPVKIARLTQTTGAGITQEDNRVIAQFARLAAQRKDIILHTTGEAARPYCYTTDAVSAILFILLKGENGYAYNVANDETYISARDMAIFLKKNFCPQIEIRVELNDNMGYAPVTKLKLSTSSLKSLGWVPRFSLYDIFNRLINSLDI